MITIILDTHVLLWSLYKPSRIAADAAVLIADRANDVLFSAAAIWEVAIKSGLGRTDFSIDPLEVVADATATGFRELPVSASAAARVAGLPPLHKDPFDRLMIAQAADAPAILLTADRLLERYSPLVRMIAFDGERTA